MKKGSSAFHYWEACILSQSVLTVSASCVEALNAVVQADSYGGEGHLSLQAGHQTVIEWARPLCPHHGADGPKHAPVADGLGSLHCRLLPLDLNTKQRKTHIRDLLWANAWGVSNCAAGISDILHKQRILDSTSDNFLPVYFAHYKLLTLLFIYEVCRELFLHTGMKKY